MAHRGPDNSIFVNDGNRCFGFHRLAINGLNSESNQPFFIKNCRLICNGEIYNHKELFQSIHTTPTTQSDCEIIIHLFIRYGIEQTLRMLDGVFSFVFFILWWMEREIKIIIKFYSVCLRLVDLWMYIV